MCLQPWCVRLFVGCAILVLLSGWSFAEPPTIVIKLDPPDETLSRTTLQIMQQGCSDFAVRLPAGTEPIVVSVCQTPEQFEALAGRFAQPGVSGIAISDEGLIAVRAPSILPPGGDYRGTLRHELIHVLLARNIDVNRLPRWLNEGIAMHLSGEHRWESSFQVAEMYVQGRVIPYFEIDYTLMLGGIEQEFGDAYAQSLSMTRYLIGEMGDDAFWLMLHDLESKSFGDALRAHFRMSPKEFFETWEGSLTSISWIFSIVSGVTLFQVMGLLVFVGWWRKRRQGQHTIRQWELDDAAASRRLPWQRPLPGDNDKWEDEEEGWIEDEDPLQPWEEDDDDDDYGYRR